MGFRVLPAIGAPLLLAAAFIFRAGAQEFDRCSDLGIPFDLVSNFEIVVQGQAGELTSLKFIVDTGSSYSTIDSRVANRLGLYRRPGTVFNFDRNRPIEWVDVPELQIGPVRVADLRMMVTRLADLSEFAENVDGIIGMDVLGRAQKVCIDYERKRIFFNLDGGPASPAATNAFVVPVSIQGISMRFLLDTGLEYLILYKDRVRSAIPNLQMEGEPRYAVVGRLRVEAVNLPRVEIPRSPGVGATQVLLIDGPGRDGLAAVDGYLGPAALHAKRLELDFATKTLRWQ